MNEFDRRWQECASRARREAAGFGQVPAGFAARAWARATAQPSAFLATAWTAPALSFRALILATAALAVLAAAEFFTASAGSALAPHLEDVVANIWGAL